MIDKSLILSKIKSHLGFKKESEFANFLGIKQNTLSTWHSRNTFDIDLISQKCDFLNYDWLLTGRGDMLKSAEGSNIAGEPDRPEYAGRPQSELEYLKSQLELTKELLKEKSKYIDMFQPLIDQMLKELVEKNNNKY